MSNENQWSAAIEAAAQLCEQRMVGLRINDPVEAEQRMTLAMAAIAIRGLKDKQ